VKVPLHHAAGASGLLTTTIQLGQAVGVAAFGSLFLTLDAEDRGPAGAAASGHALAITPGCLTRPSGQRSRPWWLKRVEPRE